MRNGDKIRGAVMLFGFFLYTPTEHKHLSTTNGEKKFFVV